MRQVTVLFFLMLFLSACGKKGPLIYPDLLVPAAPSNVSAQQTGNSIKLSFILPSKDLAGRNFNGLSGVTIHKRDEPRGSLPACTACTTDFSVFRTLNLELLPPEVQRYDRQLVLLDSDVQAGRTYTYRITTIAKDGTEGAGSISAAADMIAAPLPPVLQVVSQPTEIQLEFVGLPMREGAIAGYTLYRTLKGEMFPLVPITREPLHGNRFVDVGLERGASYIYRARTVIQLPSGALVESGPSNEVEGKLKDDE
jgi:predicted small lipoprotein YifL